MHSDILTVKDLDRYLPAIKTNEDMRFKNKLSEGIFLSDAIDGLVELPDESIDLIITEPSNGPKNEKTKKSSPTYTNYLDWMEVWLTESSRVIKSTGAIYIFCPWESSGMYHSLLSKKFHVQSRITIERNNKNSDSNKSKWENELFDIWFATKTNDYIFNQNYVVDGKILENEKNQDSKSNLWFHLDYYEAINRILKSSSFKLNWVLDPFMNSGSVGLVSKKSGRRFIGFESNQDQLLLSMKRINEGK